MLSQPNPSSSKSKIDSDFYLGGAVKLDQPHTGLKAGLDSVLLAASIPLKASQEILDLGSGCFQIGLFLQARKTHIRVRGIEAQLGLVRLGQSNIERIEAQHLCSQIHADILTDDLSDVPSNFFDHVVSNPPYFSETPTNMGSVRDPKLNSPELTTLNRTYARTVEEVHAGVNLHRWIEIAKTKLKQKGRLHLSLSDRQIVDALPYMKKIGFGGIEVLPLYPTYKKRASRFLTSAIKGSNSFDHIYGGLTLRDHKKAITPLVSQIAMNPVGVSWSEL